MPVFTQFTFWWEDTRSIIYILEVYSVISANDKYYETPILWPPDVKNWLIGKDLDAGKDWRWEEKWMTEDVMVEWNQQLNGREFGWTLGVGDGQGGLCAAVHGAAKRQTWLSDWTEQNKKLKKSRNMLKETLWKTSEDDR